MPRYLTSHNQTATSLWIPTLCPELFQTGRQEQQDLIQFSVSTEDYSFSECFPLQTLSTLHIKAFYCLMLPLVLLYCVCETGECAAHWLGGILSIWQFLFLQFFKESLEKTENSYHRKIHSPLVHHQGLNPDVLVDLQLKLTPDSCCSWLAKIRVFKALQLLWNSQNQDI